MSQKSKKQEHSQKKYPFFSSIDEIIPEGVACFRIIAEILNIPIKADLLKDLSLKT